MLPAVMAAAVSASYRSGVMVGLEPELSVGAVAQRRGDAQLLVKGCGGDVVEVEVRGVGQLAEDGQDVPDGLVDDRGDDAAVGSSGGPFERWAERRGRDHRVAMAAHLESDAHRVGPP